MFSLRCDYRENRGGCVINILKSLRAESAVVAPDKYELRDEVMTTGDYAIQCGGYIILVERKTWDDLAASIKDKRIFENHKKMLSARDQGYRIMYLIEGRAPNPENAASKVSGIPMANMMAKLDHFAMRDGVWVDYTRSAIHTAQRLLELGKNLLTLEVVGGLHAPEDMKSDRRDEDMPSNTSIIKPIANPDEIIKKKYEKTIMQVRESMLACIPGIGDKTARNLLNVVSFSRIILGPTSGLPLNSFQSSELAALVRGERPAIVISMLKEIKGVSETTARIIAREISLEKLCTRDTLTTAAIADIKMTASRRIGSKLAERISVSLSDDVPLAITENPIDTQLPEEVITPTTTVHVNQPLSSVQQAVVTPPIITSNPNSS